MLLENTVLMQIAERDKVAEPLSATRHCHIVLCLPREVLEYFTLPLLVRKHDRLITEPEPLSNKIRENQVGLRHSVSPLGLSIQLGIFITAHSGKFSEGLHHSE